MTPSKILEDLKKDPEYKKSIEKLSEEERKLTEQALENMLVQFEQSVLEPLKNLKFR